jgi:hypothetical protein
MEICIQTPLLSLLLNLVLSVGNVMLPIEDLMVDGGCIATTGGRRLFCLYYIASSSRGPWTAALFARPKDRLCSSFEEIMCRKLQMLP